MSFSEDTQQTLFDLDNIKTEPEDWDSTISEVCVDDKFLSSTSPSLDAFPPSPKACGELVSSGGKGLEVPPGVETTSEVSHHSGSAIACRDLTFILKSLKELN